MKKALCLIILLCIASNYQIMYSQTGIYPTYDDYVSNKLQEMDDFDSYIAGGKTTLYFKKDGAKVAYKCHEFWGFLYNGVLFRNLTKYSVPVRLVSKGKICYYLNGFRELHILKGDDRISDADRALSYLSQEINSDIVFIPFPYSKSDAKEYIAFMAQYPEHITLYNCIEKNYWVDNITQCIKDYQPEGWVDVD